MKESQLQKKILDYLKSKGCFAVKIITANKSGTPDIIACYEGKFLAIECKAPGNAPTALQKYQLDYIKACGGVAFVADDYKEFINEFSQVFGL